MSIKEPRVAAPTRALFVGVRIATITVSMSLILDMLQAGNRFHVVDSPIPEGTTLTAIEGYDPQTGKMTCVLEHESFALWKPGREIPDLGSITIEQLRERT
jgi:hypothetical protein